MTALTPDEIEMLRAEFKKYKQRSDDLEKACARVDGELSRLARELGDFRDVRHYLAGRFIDLQEKFLTLVEGEPPPATPPTPERKK